MDLSTLSFPERGELLQFLLFLFLLAFSLWRVERENRYLWFKDEGIVWLRLEGVPIETDRGLRFRAKVVGGDLPDIYGRTAFVNIYGLKDLPADSFSLYAHVKAEGSELFISGSYRDIEDIFSEKTLRKSYIDRVQERIQDPQVRAFVLTYLLGEARESLPQDLQYYFTKTGLIHLLVISGFHVGMVFLLLRYLLPYPYGLLLGVVGVSLYVLLLVPKEAPVLRAGLMLSLWVLVRLSEGRPNSLGILLFSGSLLLLYRPEFSQSFSFWLSFFAVLYIILGLRLLPSEGSWVYRNLGLPFGVSLFAFLGVSPLLLSFTHTSLGSVLFSPLVGYMLLPFTAYGVLELITFFSLPTLPLELMGKAVIQVVELLSVFDLRVGFDLSVGSSFAISTLGAFLLYLLSLVSWRPVSENIDIYT
ncbi:ComEC/Rec2 family competence protein [Pampinifervens florentissimum]|uniref:ComEC/Rec2 family competence protein n=1 Tax=Pampinifervens florentissimum TaxID=1632019 RepID=UPI0013B498B3|nr:ComEC/Rec2 family competence protein [Hydrogenobacter sp. T-8]QID33183.1 ComEC/Rec2 family competence protein [Hydrogenobacter sp. T-8]